MPRTLYLVVQWQDRSDQPFEQPSKKQNAVHISVNTVKILQQPLQEISKLATGFFFTWEKHLFKLSIVVKPTTRSSATPQSYTDRKKSLLGRHCITYGHKVVIISSILVQFFSEENWSLTCARFSTTRKSSVRPLSTGGTNVGADPDPVKTNKHTDRQIYQHVWSSNIRERTIFNHSVHALKVPTCGKVNYQENKVWFSKSLEFLPFATAQMNAGLENKISNSTNSK